MFKFTMFLLMLCCMLTGYRLVGQAFPATNTFQSAVNAQSGTPDDTADVAPTDTTGNTPVPTIAPLFRMPTGGTPQPSPTPTGSLPEATQAASNPPIATPTAQPLSYPEIMIYDDELTANWSVEHSNDVRVNLWDTTHWFQKLHPQLDLTSGSTSIAVVPQADYGSLYFTVRPESTTAYKRTDLLGVSFWLNSGSTMLGTDNLTVAVVGSNQQPAWSADDTSVFPDQAGAFSETRLYFLQVNRAIPADTWVNIIVWLNDLDYDPVYQYVTGFYIKNDVGFRSTYYIDRVTLITNDAQ